MNKSKRDFSKAEFEAESPAAAYPALGFVCVLP